MGVTVAVTRVALNTGTGTQDITTTDLGGLTPKAVKIIVTRCVTDGTAADGAGFYWGLSDGTNEAAGGYESEHGQASMDNQLDQDTTANRLLTIYDGTADSVVEATIDFDSFITNGVRINITDAPAAAYLATVTLYAGSDLSAHVGKQDLGNTADALIAITSVGFEADVLEVFMNHSYTGAGGDSNMSMGLVHNDRASGVTQRCIVHGQRGSFSSSQVRTMYRDGECIAKLQNVASLDWIGTAQSFDSSGFDIQLGNGRAPGNADIAWLALRLGSSPAVSAKVYTFSTPTGTGSAADNGLGSEPQFVMYLATRSAVADTVETDADGGTVGMVLADADEAYTQSISDEDAALDSNTQSLSDDKLNLPTHTGASGQEASLTSMGSGGVTWNWTAVDATARLWPALAIGINPAAGGSILPLVAVDMANISDMKGMRG